MLEMILCGCKSETCFANRCRCYRHQLTCSDICGCQNWSNQFEGDWNAITDSATDDESGAESDKFESESEIEQKYGRS